MSRKEYVTKGVFHESNIFLRRGNYFVSSFSVNSRYIMITMMIFTIIIIITIIILSIIIIITISRNFCYL